MAVDLEQISLILPGEASGPAGSSAAPLTDNEGESAAARPKLYDPLWGYFRFGVTVAAEAGPAGDYAETLTYTIEGVFTPDANADRPGTSVPDPATLAADLTAQSARYDALQAIWDAAAAAEPPADPAEWETDADPGAVALPAPIASAAGPIHALPVSLEVLPGRWGAALGYRATLRKGARPLRRVRLAWDGRPGEAVDLHDARVELDVYRPLLEATPMYGVGGAAYAALGFASTEIALTGRVARPRGAPAAVDRAAEQLADLAETLLARDAGERLRLGVNTLPGDLDPHLDDLFGPLDPAEPPALDLPVADEPATLQWRLRDGGLSAHGRADARDRGTDPMPEDL